MTNLDELIQKNYLRIVEIMITDEYPCKIEKIDAISVVCDRVRSHHEYFE